MRFAVQAAVGLLALAGGGAVAHADTASPIADLQAATTATSATVRWTTSTPTRGLVVYGAGDLDLWSGRESVPSTSHVVELPDLDAATTYSFRVEAGGAAADGSFRTAAASSAPRFGVEGTHVTADGSLFFPILGYEQCAQTVDRALSVGIDMVVQAPYTGCDKPARGTPPYVLSDVYDASRGVGWYLPDEPDGWGLTPEELPQLAPAAETGRLRVLGISQHFFSGQAKINAGFDRSEYTRYAEDADLIGFDMYPIVKFCGRVPLIDDYRAQRELMTTYAPGKPTFQWIETGPMTGECPTLQVTPEIVNAETWLAVAGGACGIGYFTSSWTGGIWNRWDVAPEVEQQIAATVARVRALAPALCAGYGAVVVPWNGTVAASSRTLEGALYVIAVNGSARPTTVPFRVDALAGRTLNVLDENRTISPVKKVYFRDRFAPYQVHVYVAPPPAG